MIPCPDGYNKTSWNRGMLAWHKISNPEFSQEEWAEKLKDRLDKDKLKKVLEICKINQRREN